MHPAKQIIGGGASWLCGLGWSCCSPVDGSGRCVIRWELRVHSPISKPTVRSLLPTPPATENYRPDIDGLRAFAVLSVVLYHAFPKTIRGGYVGVDIFFVISGFLISSILFTEMTEGRFAFTIF